MDNKTLYKLFIKLSGKANKTADNFANSLDGMVTNAISNNIDDSVRNLYDISDISRLKQLRESLNKVKAFVDQNTKGKNMYTCAIDSYIGMYEFIALVQQEFNEEPMSMLNNSESHQIIYYGAPGTGKSHKIKEILGEYDGCPEEKKVPKQNIFRTTFHPDSDYSTFVGAYKPKMKKYHRYDGKGFATFPLDAVISTPRALCLFN